MARRWRGHNPDLFGVNLEQAIIGAGGLAGTALVNDKVIGKYTAQLLPEQGMLGKLVDAGSTLISAAALGWVVGKLNRSWGRDVTLGGGFLAGGRFISSFVSGFSISPNFPASLDSLHLPGLTGGATTPAAGVTAGKAAPTPALPASLQDAFFNDYPRPISTADDVGL